MTGRNVKAHIDCLTAATERTVVAVVLARSAGRRPIHGLQFADGTVRMLGTAGALRDDGRLRNALVAAGRDPDRPLTARDARRLRRALQEAGRGTPPRPAPPPVPTAANLAVVSAVLGRPVAAVTVDHGPDATVGLVLAYGTTIALGPEPPWIHRRL